MGFAKILSNKKKVIYTEETVQKAKADNAYDMFKNFWNDSIWDKYNRNQKKNAFFMINRIMSIKFPEEAALMCRYGIDGGNMVEFWRRLMKKQTKSVPSWIYTKTKGMKKETGLKFNFDSSVYEYFLKLNKCSMKEVDYVKRLFPEELYSELKSIDDMINSYEK